MIKKSMVALFCLSLVSVAIWSWAATTWTLQSKLSNPGGTIKVRNNATQTAVGTVVYTNFTTAASIPVSVAANNGYKITGLNKSGAVVTIGNYTSHYSTTFQKSGGTSQSLVASFTAQQLAVTGTVVGAGTISPTSTSVAYGGTVILSSNPASGSSFLTNVSGGTVTDLSGNPVTLPYAAAVKITASNVTAPRSVTATYTTFSVDAGASQLAMINSQVALNGSIVGGGTPSWSQVSGPAVTLAGATTLSPTFTPTSAGTYLFQLTEYVGGTPLVSATTQVSIVNFVADYMRSSCMGCHASNGVSPAPKVFAVWSSSNHKAAGVSCITCHTDAAMPTPVNTFTVDRTNFMVTASSAGTVGTYYCAKCHSQTIMADFDGSRHKIIGVTCSSCHTAGPHNPAVSATACNGCHLDGNGNFVGQHVERGANTCADCHNPHSTVAMAVPSVHFNNVTSAGYPASYVTSRSICKDCHYDSASNATIRGQWASSGHGAVTEAPWISYDFKTQSGCVQCHTTTGFIAYSTGKVTAAWGVSSDKSKEVLACIGCHSDMTRGVVRTVSPVKPFADDAYVNRNVGESNICIGCHSGTNNGNSIAVKVGSADFTNLPFIAPHYLAAGATLHAKAGYAFPGQTYAFYSSNSHRLIGMGNKSNTGSAGPCVGCHMWSEAQRHLYKTVTTDVSGTITSIDATDCINCHADSLGVTQLNANKAAYVNALNVLKAMLASKGFIYTTSSPYFNNTNWGTGQAGANAMGAAYNYLLLLSEPGAYTHNSAYAKKLIVDSIDCLYNGSVTGSIESALASLVGSGAISQQAADQLSTYKAAPVGCTSCHDTSSTGTHAKHQAEGLSCAQCHSATALSGSTQVPGNTTHLNGQVDVLIAQANNKSGGMNFNKAGNSCSGVSCHGNGTQTVSWGTSGLVTCESCHVGSLSVIDGVTAQDLSLSTTRGHGKPGIGNLCLDCHDGSKQHLGGAGMLKAPLTGTLNTECNYCHNDTTLITNPAFSKMRAHLNKNGQESACVDCHDPHGTTNLAMIRTSILGQRITFTTESELIDQTTNMGFCQVCHTKTKYFLAGVPETSHDTTGCFGCHDHKSANGGFLTKPTKQCDSCHGYPPAPRQAALPVGVGTMGNWSSALFERYSGGGGAHLVAAHVPKNARPSEGWNNCSMCHNSVYHRTDLMPDNPPVIISHVRVEVQAQYRFSNGFTVYTGAKLVDPPARNVTGSCFNLSCHMSPSPRWSTER